MHEDDGGDASSLDAVVSAIARVHARTDFTARVRGRLEAAGSVQAPTRAAGAHWMAASGLAWAGRGTAAALAGVLMVALWIHVSDRSPAPIDRTADARPAMQTDRANPGSAVPPAATARAANAPSSSARAVPVRRTAATSRDRSSTVDVVLARLATPSFTIDPVPIDRVAIAGLDAPAVELKPYVVPPLAALPPIEVPPIDPDAPPAD